ncbi:MAG: hypothetical protein QJT81_02465 [Candidatus Thiothrix putei]|uniref:Uncharacterized protein n=1 Tax=Candidatus Thiothrix putei TaxID=3080811 RepID=A0AA95HEU1_9GAMM|nr:MAG: hypothetical protein QJT81_02465 [Candidatus Thiothrix putei]
MNIHQLHVSDSSYADSHECTPCEASPRPASARYWPKVRMQRRRLSGRLDERLSIEISNPWPELVLRHVNIAFLSTDPHHHQKNSSQTVKFVPTHGIEFGDITYEKAMTRDIIMIDHQPGEEGHQIYAGVCFTAVTKTGEVKHYGYLLFKSNLLLAEEAFDQAA